MIDGKLSLVLPAHDEDQNIEHVVNRAVEILPRFTGEFEILVVNDGSTDRTGELVRQMAASIPSIRLVTHEFNRGYGAALRSGFAASTGDWVMVMDSDRQFDIGDLIYLAPFSPHYDLVAGYRIQRNDPIHRTLFGKTFRLAMRTLFGIQLYDIDCAFKLIRGDLLRSLKLESDGAMISTELMARWARAGGTWTQVGVYHYPRTAGLQSGGSIRVILRAMRDVPRLWWRLNRETRPDQTRYDDSSQSANATGVSPALAAGILSAAATLIVLFFVKLWQKRQ